MLKKNPFIFLFMTAMLVLSCKSSPVLENDERTDEVPSDTSRSDDSTIRDLELKITGSQDPLDLETKYFLILELIAERPNFHAEDFHQLLGLTLARDYNGVNQLSNELILDAARHFEKALQENPASDSLHLIMAQYLFGLMTLNTELSTPYGDVQTMSDRGMESINNALSYGANPAECYYLKGKMYRYQNNFLDAMEAFRESVNSDPSFILAYEAGYNVSIELGYPDQAKSWLAEGIERNPSSYELSSILAHQYASEQDYSRAIDVMSTYLDKAATIPKEAFFDLGYFFEKDNQRTKAIEQYKLAIAQDSTYLDVYYRLGRMYKDHRQWNDAYETFSELLKRLPLNHSYREEIRKTLETIEREL
ncbi:MAG: tetratricopeptide repeat protein [Bacteroidota bacterium]|nr:tetratricopeptide repeat protein [Bacteroidota bacterium]